MSPTAVAPARIRLDLEGMTCASCAARIERQLNAVAGVEATVNLATEAAAVTYDPDRVAVDELIRTVEAAGYRAAPARESNRTETALPLARRLAVAVSLTVPLTILAMAPPLQFTGWEWLAFALATPVVLWAGWPFHRAAAANARHLAATMDTLISIGTLAAWGWSAVVLIGGVEADTYFEVGAVITTLILLGRYLEARARRRAGAAIRALLELGAKEARVLSGGRERLVPIRDLRVGDRFVVLPGEKVATDGIVEAGDSAVDQSMLTGEPAPVEVAQGDPVTGGTINTYGRLVVRANRVGADTALAHIARLVEEAQTGKAPVQRLADRVSAVFVPVVIGVALATLVGWLVVTGEASSALSAAVAVLIISCPCALGLATPTALMVGTGRGAQLGILIRGPEILEQTRRVQTIVLDKTGTVTEGKMELVDVVPLNGAAPDEALLLAGAVEAASEHPIGRAVATAARRRGELPPVEGFRNVPGVGVRGVVAGREVEVARRGGAVTVVVDGRPLATLEVRDTVKPTSETAVRELRALGLAPVLLTGDAEKTAVARRGRSRDRPRDRRRAARRESNRGAPAPGRRRGGGDGRGRCQRRAGARSGRPGDRARHRHRRRHRGERPDPGLGRPAGCRRRDPARPADPAHDQGQPVLGVRVQRRGDPACGGRAPEPDRRRRGDGVLERVRRREQPAAEAVRQLEGGVMEHGYDKDALTKRLHRIEGQVRGIERMVADDRYCIDILTQIGAVSSALDSLAFEVLDDHVNHCVAACPRLRRSRGGRAQA